MSIFDMFKSQPAPAPAQQPAPTNPGNMPADAAPNANPQAGTAPNGVTPEAVAPAADTPNPPLEEFSKLWETVPNDSESTPNQPVPLDAAQVQAAVAKTDFSSAITPEMLANIAAGGEGATAAFAQAMNQVAQQVMVQSTMVNSKLTDKAVADAMAAQQASLPDLVRSQQASSHLVDSNPLFTNPAVKPVIEATQAQLLLKFPNATPAEITTMTQNYITQMGAAFAPQEKVNDNSGADSTDWDKYFS